MGNESIKGIKHPSMGKARMVGTPIKFSKTLVNIEAHVLNFGEHSEDVLLNVLGYNWDQIIEQKDDEII